MSLSILSLWHIASIPCDDMNTACIEMMRADLPRRQAATARAMANRHAGYIVAVKPPLLRLPAHRLAQLQYRRLMVYIQLSPVAS